MKTLKWIIGVTAFLIVFLMVCYLISELKKEDYEVVSSRVTVNVDHKFKVGDVVGVGDSGELILLKHTADTIREYRNDTLIYQRVKSWYDCEQLNKPGSTINGNFLRRMEYLKKR